MATQAKYLSNSWEQLSSGNCIFQVQEGEVLTFIGSEEPTNDDSINSYIIGNFFSYTGNENVYVKARGKAKIVYDSNF